MGSQQQQKVLLAHAPFLCILCNANCTSMDYRWCTMLFDKKEDKGHSWHICTIWCSGSGVSGLLTWQVSHVDKCSNCWKVKSQKCIWALSYKWLRFECSKLCYVWVLLYIWNVPKRVVWMSFLLWNVEKFAWTFVYFVQFKSMYACFL